MHDSLQGWMRRIEHCKARVADLPGGGFASEGFDFIAAGVRLGSHFHGTGGFSKLACV